MNLRTLIINTSLVQNDALLNGRSGTGMAVISLTTQVMKGVKVKKFFATIMSQTDPKAYTAILEFLRVEDQTIPSIELHDVRVRCSCKAFYFYYSYWDKQNQTLSGPNPTPYVRKTTYLPEKNPRHIPGICKHLVRLAIVLRNEKLIQGYAI